MAQAGHTVTAVEISDLPAGFDGVCYWNGFGVGSDAAGYDHELHERTRFDPVTCTVFDTWWPASAPEQANTTSISPSTSDTVILFVVR
jgi:hypothetical protein